MTNAKHQCDGVERVCKINNEETSPLGLIGQYSEMPVIVRNCAIQVFKHSISQPLL